jgi:hypothetical protein
MLSKEEIDAVEKKYAHYPASLNKNTAVYHIRELLKHIKELDKQEQ